MEKILSKSKSRYFFGGKKKSAKEQGISSSDVPMVASEARSENFGLRNTPPHPTPRIVQGGAPTIATNGPRVHHTRTSPGVNSAPEHFLQMHRPDNSVSASVHQSNHALTPQSRFEVHISPTAFSPIIMPSSTPPRAPHIPSVSMAPSQRRELPPSNQRNGGEQGVEYAPRTGDIHAHSRSQSAIAPDQMSNLRGRQRRHGIPGNFLENNGATPREAHHWNGQSLGAERYISDALKSGPSSSASDTFFVQPSASAPVTSSFSAIQTRHLLPDLRESSTVPALSTNSPLPRSSPSYNLAGLTPTPSVPSPPKPPAEVDIRTSSRPPRHPNRELDLRPRRDPPPAPHSASPVPVSDISTSFNAPSSHHTPNVSVSSETGIGYKGLAFPLPPSSEEGLAMSYSSSQSSIFSVASGRKIGDAPTTPKRTREGKEDRDARTPKSTASRSTAAGSGQGSRERNINVNEGRTSPTPNMGTLRRRREREDPQVSETDTDGERDTIRNAQENAEKELVNVLGVELGESNLANGITKASHARATSEASHDDPPSAHPQTQRPRISEPTKPLSLTPGRKTLHTMRSISTGLGERKQLLHPSTSNRDLSSTFNGINGRSERIRTTTAIPVRAAAQRDVPGAFSQPDAQLPTPPQFVLPTPPHSSSALSFLAGEQKGTGTASVTERRPTLEDVTNALRTQRGRFDELAGYVLDVAQQHAAERDAYAGRVGRLEGAVAKMEREIRGLRWLVLEHAKARQSVAEAPAAAVVEVGGSAGDAERKLRRSITMPQLAAFPPPRPTHARSKRDAIGLGLGFSPDSVLSSPDTLSPPQEEKKSHEHPPETGDRTPSMDEIIDKLMGVRQWAGADVRVSVVDTGGTDGGGGGDRKRIVFREP